jgi:crotonobetainyl-CoA:carnitine CoA-transferase CaiB-like acyl-CoA transferase
MANAPMHDQASAIPNSRPLDGHTVVEFAQMIAAPSASLLLQDYGARVIKVEPPAGDGGRNLRSAGTRDLAVSPIFAAYNRDKELLTLDLSSEEGHAHALELIAEADVLIESSRPGAMDRLGLGAAQVCARFPQLVYASVTGFGVGPIGRKRGGVDIVVQAESGMMGLTGYPDGPPTKIGFTAIDAACGHAICHGILAAMLQRTRTGKGAHVSISLYDVALHLQTGPIAEYLATGNQAERTGNSSPLSAPADLFRCADGALVVSAYLETHWQRFAEIIGAPELARDSRFESGLTRVAHRAELIRLIEQRLMTRNAAEWAALFHAAGVLAGQVKNYDQVLDDPLFAESGIVISENGNFGVSNPVRLAVNVISEQ